MDKDIDESKKRSNQASGYGKKDLILSINNDEKIIKFNDECEKISGYTSDYVLNKHFFDVLIPKRYLKQWKKIIYFIQKNKMINDFRLPLLTRHGHEIMVSWSSFPVGDGKSDISLVGTLVTSWDGTDDTFNIPLKKDIEDMEDFDKVIDELERRNIELVTKNKDLEEKIQAYKNRDLVGSGLYRFSDIVGGKKSRQEIETMIKELDEREYQINKLMTKLTKDKKKVNDRRNEFIRWRKNLESLENEIQSRREEIETQEKMLGECFLIANKQPMQVSKTVEAVKHYPDPLEGIKDCAVVIQRGILKQATFSFAELIGYNFNEIVERSIFDFIVPEGFSSIENYYFKRLKGEEISYYETVILTKDNDKIRVRVSTQPTTFNGEKAEVAIFKILK